MADSLPPNDEGAYKEIVALLRHPTDKAVVIKRLTVLAGFSQKIPFRVATLLLQKIPLAESDARVALLLTTDSLVKKSSTKSLYRELLVTVPQYVKETMASSSIREETRAKLSRMLGTWTDVFSKPALMLSGRETEAEFAEIYRNFLVLLSQADDSRIFGLTAVTDLYSHFATTITDVLFRRIRTTPPSDRLPLFYLMDSVVQKTLSRDLYRSRFKDEGFLILVDTLLALREIINSAPPPPPLLFSSSSSSLSSSSSSLVKSAQVCADKLTKLQAQWNMFFDSSGEVSQAEMSRGRRPSSLISSSARPPRTPPPKRPKSNIEEEPTITLPAVSIAESKTSKEWAQAPVLRGPGDAAHLKQIETRIQLLLSTKPEAEPFITEFWRLMSTGDHHSLSALEKSGLKEVLVNSSRARERLPSYPPSAYASAVPRPPPTPIEFDPAAVGDLLSELFRANGTQIRPYTRVGPRDNATMRKLLPPPPRYARQTVPYDHMFDLDILKKRDEAAIDELYDQLTCVCCNCGLRKRTEAEMKVHLDWHYVQNNLKALSADAPRSSRMWFKTPQEWVKKRLFVDAVETKIEIADPVIGTPKPAPQQRFKIPVSDRKDFCTVCGEKFEQFWDHEEDCWMFDEAVKVPFPDSRYSAHIADTDQMAERKALVRREKDKVDRTYRNHILHRRCYQGSYELFDDLSSLENAYSLGSEQSSTVSYSTTVTQEVTGEEDNDSDVQETEISQRSSFKETQKTFGGLQETSHSPHKVIVQEISIVESAQQTGIDAVPNTLIHAEQDTEMPALEPDAEIGTNK